MMTCSHLRARQGLTQASTSVIPESACGGRTAVAVANKRQAQNGGDGTQRRVAHIHIPWIFKLEPVRLYPKYTRASQIFFFSANEAVRADDSGEPKNAQAQKTYDLLHAGINVLCSLRKKN